MIDKPFLNEQELKSLNNKLNLNKIAEVRCEQRVRNRNLYIDYDFNPFSNSKNSRNHYNDYENLT